MEKLHMHEHFFNEFRFEFNFIVLIWWNEDFIESGERSQSLLIKYKIDTFRSMRVFISPIEIY